MQTYCFRFYFFLVTVIILAGMVSTYTRTAGDDNEKNSGAIALRISDTQAVNLVLRASWSQIYWRSTINLKLGIQVGPGR